MSVKRLGFCKTPELIENYELAKADNFKGWQCHHGLESHNSDGERRLVDLTKKELIALGMYYNRPPEELIYMTTLSHRQLHSLALKGKKRSKEFSESCSLRQKGIHWYTNGSIDVHAVDCPEGFTLGRSHKPSESFKRSQSKIKSKCKWWTDGTLSKFCEVCPDGYWAGRVMKSSNKNWKRG